MKWFIALCIAAWGLGTLTYYRFAGGVLEYKSRISKEDRGVSEYRRAAERGDAAAQCKMGACYERGFGVDADPVEAVKWYRKAAERGHGEAQYRLGECCAAGRGMEKDLVEAVKWYRAAAEQGHREAQYRLGACCADGKGMVPDLAGAMKWYRRAAEQGHAGAQYETGEFYAKGCVVAKDSVEAVKWYRKAAEQGHPEAKRALEKMGVPLRPPSFPKPNGVRIGPPPRSGRVRVDYTVDAGGGNSQVATWYESIPARRQPSSIRQNIPVRRENNKLQKTPFRYTPGKRFKLGRPKIVVQ